MKDDGEGGGEDDYEGSDEGDFKVVVEFCFQTDERRDICDCRVASATEKEIIFIFMYFMIFAPIWVINLFWVIKMLHPIMETLEPENWPKSNNCSI